MYARLTTSGIVTMDSSVDDATTPTDSSTSRLNFAENMVQVAAVGAEQAMTKAMTRLRLMPKGASAVMSFGVKGGREAGENFLEHLELCSIVVHVGDIHTSVLHPASTTHRQLSEEAQLAAGIDPGLIRLSVGLENPEDIIADLDQALNKVK